MYQLVYASSATVPFEKENLLDLLAGCRARNEAAGVTGMLLYKDGNFMQALEGERAVVQKLYETIRRDRRHRGIMTLLQGEIAERHFPGWAMAFRDLKSPELASLPGFSAFLNTPLTGREFAHDPSRSERLLLTFRRTM